MSFWGNLFNREEKPKMEFKVGEGLTPEQKATAETVVRKPLDVGKTLISSGYYNPINENFFQKQYYAQNVINSPSASKEEKQQAIRTIADPTFGAVGSLEKTILKNPTKSVLNFFAKETNPTIIEKELKNLGVSADDAINYSSKLAKTKTIQEVKDVLTQTEQKASSFWQKEPPSLKPLVRGKNNEAINIGDGIKIESKNPLEKGKVIYGIVREVKGSKIKVYPSENPLFGGAIYDDSRNAITKTNLNSEQLKAIDDAGKRMHEASQDMVPTGKEYIPISQRLNELKSNNVSILAKPDIIKQATEARKTRLTEEGFIQKIPSEVDKFIAQGKIRVVSRDGRDVYQYKKGNQWQNARDEDGAIKQITKEPYQPKPKQYAPKDQEKIDLTRARLENVRDILAEHPAKPLLKFKKEGVFQDLKNPNLVKNEFRKQQLVEKRKKIFKTAESAFEGTKYSDSFSDEDSIREAIEDYERTRQLEKSLIETRKELEATLKPIEKEIPKESKVLSSQADLPIIDTTKGEGRSIEIQAKQALDILNNEPVSINTSLPKIIEQTITPVKKKVHLIDTYLRTPNRVMEKIGLGKEAVELRSVIDEYWKELPKNMEVISNWAKKISNEDNETLFRYLDGEAITLTPELQKTADEIKGWLKQWADRLKLPDDNRITHYITHIFEPEFIAKEFDEELAKIISDKIPGQVYDPFLLKRLGKFGYKTDTWEALDAYVKRATRKVHLDPVLEKIRDKTGSSLDVSPMEESQFEYVKKYIDNINMRPTKFDKSIDNLVKSLVGYRFGQRPVNAILRPLRQLTYRGTLGLNLGSALRNISQGVNSYAILGEKYTALGYINLFKKGAGEELLREGVLNAGFIQDRGLSATKKLVEKLDKTLFYFFDRAEKLNRGSVYFGAKAKALSKGLSEEQAIQYAKDIVRKTQFSFDTVDTPVGLASDFTKTLAQLQTYTIKQSEFLYELAKTKNYQGLLRYAIGGLAFVYTIGKAFGMEPKELLPIFRFDTPASLKTPTEITKALLDSPDKYGKDRDLKQKLKDIGRSATTLFPAGSQIKKTYEGLTAVNEGGSFTKNGKIQFKQGESLPEKAQSILFGKYASQNAKDYFDDISVAEKEYARLKTLPKEEANAIVKEYKKNDPNLYNSIKKLKEDESLGITEKDKEIRNLGVENKARAKFILEEVNKLKTPEEKNAYIKDLREKKIITDKVFEQIKELKNKPVSKNNILDVFKPKIAYADEPKSYYIRNNEITDADLSELRAILFGEISNRNKDKQKLEAQVILNTVFNRMDEYRRKGQNKTATRVVQMPEQYQAFTSNEYKRYKNGDLKPTDKQKLEAIDEILEKVKNKTFQNNIKNAYYYKHNKDDTIEVDFNRPLFAKK